MDVAVFGDIAAGMAIDKWIPSAEWRDALAESARAWPAKRSPGIRLAAGAVVLSATLAR